MLFDYKFRPNFRSYIKESEIQICVCKKKIKEKGICKV